MRKCNTRSHSELGSQAFLRRWYFVLRHGRVGHCQAIILNEKSINCYWWCWLCRIKSNWIINKKLIRFEPTNPAPPVTTTMFFIWNEPGNVLLFHVLRQSTIGAERLDFRVRNGIGYYPFAIITRQRGYIFALRKCQIIKPMEKKTKWVLFY